MTRHQFSSIQYLRAFATLTVVAAHTDAWFFPFGEAAVSLFFVISGFVMIHVSQKRSSPGQFLWARFIRVAPLYWLMTLYVAVRSGAPIDRIVMSLTFWPHAGPHGRGWPIVGQGWTLVIEVFFYVVFAFALLRPARGRPFLVAGVFTGLAALGFLFRPTNWVLSTYTSPLLLEFACGALLHETWRRGYLPRRWGAIGLLGLALLLLVVIAFTGSEQQRWAGWGVVSVILLAGAIGLEDSGWLPRLPFLQLIGDACYSLYLVQFFAINPVHRHLAHWPPLLSTAIAVVGATAFGLAVYFAIERPLARVSTRVQNALAGPFQRAADRRPA